MKFPVVHPRWIRHAFDGWKLVTDELIFGSGSWCWRSSLLPVVRPPDRFVRPSPVNCRTVRGIRSAPPLPPAPGNCRPAFPWTARSTTTRPLRSRSGTMLFSNNCSRNWGSPEPTSSPRVSSQTRRCSCCSRWARNNLSLPPGFRRRSSGCGDSASPQRKRRPGKWPNGWSRGDSIWFATSSWPVPTCGWQREQRA